MTRKRGSVRRKAGHRKVWLVEDVKNPGAKPPVPIPTIGQPTIVPFPSVMDQFRANGGRYHTRDTSPLGPNLGQDLTRGHIMRLGPRGEKYEI